MIGVNASSYRIKRYFQDEQALVFSVDATGAPGTHWSEVRMGPIRPLLDWKIEAVRINQSAVDRFKNILGEIPYTAELYWLLRSPNKPIRSRFTLANLQKHLPQLIAEMCSAG